MIRVGVVGAGMVFRLYQRAASKVRGLKISAVYDLDPQRAAAFFDQGAVAESLGELLRSAIDAVFILSPNATHVALVQAALDRGLAVLCEKPLAPTPGEAEQLLTLADDRRLLLYAAMHVRHRPEVIRANDHLDGGISAFQQVWLEDWTSAPAWYLHAVSSRGGVLLDVGINQIDWVAPLVAGLRPMRAEAVLGEEVETACLIEWSFDGGNGSTNLDWRAQSELKVTTFISREGRSVEVNHDHRCVKLDGQILGPWADDEYEGVLRDFVSRYYERHWPNDRTPVRNLSLIQDVYSQLGLEFVCDAYHGRRTRDESAYP
jgi:predicted dehydrogenase